MVTSFREALEGLFIEFQKNILLEVSRLEETLVDVESSKQHVHALIPARGTTSAGCATEKGEDCDMGPSKQRKKHALAESKKDKQVKFQRGPNILMKQWDSEADCLLQPVCDKKIGGSQSPDVVGRFDNDIAVGRERHCLTPPATFSTPASGVTADPIVVASCPEAFHDEVANICVCNRYAKAFGQQGDMLDTLSGDDWVGKWEAKVVISAVTTARAMMANHVKIICIQGGKHCDKEVAAQPRLKKAILQEFGGNLRVALEWLEIDEFRQRYVCKGGIDAVKIYMCHKHSHSVDAVLRLKIQIEERLPETIFFNVGLEEHMSNETTDAEVKNCNYFLIFLTKDALLEQHVLLQIQYALQHKKHCLLVMETDRAYGGVSLDDETRNLEDDSLKDVFKKNIMIPWSRDSSVQEVSLDKIIASLTSGAECNRWMPMSTGQSLEDQSIYTMFHPSFHFFCNCAGIPLPGAWRTTYARGFMTIGLAWLSLLFAVCLAVLPHGEEARDIRDVMFWPMALVVISFASYFFGRLLGTQEVKELFALHKHDLDLRRLLHARSRQLTNLGLVLMILFSVLFLVPQFAALLDRGEETSSASQLDLVVRFAWRFGVPLCAIPCIIQAACLVPIIHCVFFVALMSFASTFSQLHPQIKDFGIATSVEQGMIIHVTDSSFVRFQRMYIDVWKRVRILFSWIACALICLYICWIINFVLHVICVLDLAKNGKPASTVSGFTKDGWHSTSRTLPAFVFDGYLLAPFFYMHQIHRNISVWVARLIFTKSFTRVAISNFVNELFVDLPVLPMSERFRLDPSMTHYFVLLVLVRWLLFAFEFYIVDY